MNKRTLGGEYETIAAEFLQQQGYRILERNYHCKFGEIDIIAKDGSYYVFIEVKYRHSRRFGSPEEALDPRKIQHITRVAKSYLYERGLNEFTPCRFDVVVILDHTKRLIKNAFEAMG